MKCRARAVRSHPLSQLGWLLALLPTVSRSTFEALFRVHAGRCYGSSSSSVIPFGGAENQKSSRSVVPEKDNSGCAELCYVQIEARDLMREIYEERLHRNAKGAHYHGEEHFKLPSKKDSAFKYEPDAQQIIYESTGDKPCDISGNPMLSRNVDEQKKYAKVGQKANASNNEIYYDVHLKILYFTMQ
jgi:hypothetical protein